MEAPSQTEVLSPADKFNATYEQFSGARKVVAIAVDKKYEFMDYRLFATSLMTLALAAIAAAVIFDGSFGFKRVAIAVAILAVLLFTIGLVLRISLSRKLGSLENLQAEEDEALTARETAEANMVKSAIDLFFDIFADIEDVRLLEPLLQAQGNRASVRIRCLRYADALGKEVRFYPFEQQLIFGKLVVDDQQAKAFLQQLVECVQTDLRLLELYDRIAQENRV